jgi:RimJ/RimL family protein N-acetyltransferase
MDKHPAQVVTNRSESVCKGTRTVLQPAEPQDETRILDWLLRSDITPALIGPPLYPERPLPLPGETGETFDSYYFDGTAPELGRSFLILVDGEAVGQVNYNDVVVRNGRKGTELDIWLRSESVCGKGYGSDALQALCLHLHKQMGVQEFMVQPSARNPRAIRAYEKIGFARLNLPIDQAREIWGANDYVDSVYMVKTIVP